MSIVQEGFRLQEQHEVVMGLFKLDSAKQMIEGSMIEFYARLIFILVSALAFMFLFDVVIPTVLQGIMMGAAIFLAVFATMSFLVSMNKNIAEDGFLWIVKHGIFLLMLLVVISLVA